MVSTRQMSITSGGVTDYGNGTGDNCVPTRHLRSHLDTPDHNDIYNQPSTSADTPMSYRVTRQNSHLIVATTTTERQVKSFLNLPEEILSMILKNLSFKNVCHMRLVCKRFDLICAQILNSTFQKLLFEMGQRFQAIKSLMPRRESARRNHHLACESDIIETLHMRLTLLQMSFGKHIERNYCCFFPGEILDEVYNILHIIKVTPKLSRPYKVTDELFDLSTMAMEYFKEKIEPDLPEIAYFGKDFLDFTGTFSCTNKYLALDSSPLSSEEVKETDRPNDILDNEEPLPQSNMVLRKRIRKIKQGMKRYNSQLSLLKQDLRSCKRKTAEQQKQISDQQKQMAEQQKQNVEYASRLDEYDKKNEEISRKFSTLLQELNKCKTELQYWRSKSPATPPFCTGCGAIVIAPPDELEALENQGLLPDVELNFVPIPEISDLENEPSLIDPTPLIQSEEPAPPTITLPKEEPPAAKRKMDETPTTSKGRRAQKNRSKRIKL